MGSPMQNHTGTDNNSMSDEQLENFRFRNGRPVNPFPAAPQITTPMAVPDSNPFSLGGSRRGGYGGMMGGDDESSQLYQGLDTYRQQLIRNFVSRYWR